MLVCSVSMRPARRAIAADLAELATAADMLGTGNVIFATLVDDPASVADTVDAYLGEIMLEAANASDTIGVGLEYSGAVTESVSAADTQDGAIAAVGYTTWNPADTSGTAVVISNGNLTAQNATGGNNQGARGVASKTTGKFYVEFTWSNLGSADGYAGIALASEGWFNLAFGFYSLAMAGTNGSFALHTVTTPGMLPTAVNGQTTCVAIDLVNNRFWARTNNGNWNLSGTADPASNVGGFNISSVAWSGGTKPVFIGTFNPATVTANFGASAFAYTPPSGFGGWTS